MDHSSVPSSSSKSHPETENEIENNRPSTSYSAAHPCNQDYYQVFINHRGPDTKNSIASILYHSLTSRELKVFLDKKEMQPGKYIASQIEGAIRTASVHVAIFSPGYAESNWCLDELVLMRESGGIIIPVFFEVKPSELKCEENSSYAKALHEHKTKKRYDDAKIEKWRNALADVAGISGFELEAFNGDQGELVNKVVNSVRENVKKPNFQVAKYPTGADEKVKDFEKTVVLTEQQGEKPQVAGIFGFGGVGLDRLEQALPDEIQNIITTSYNNLATDEREIFLDIVSFFIGERRDMALRIWDGDKEGYKQAFQNLQNKSIVEVDSENKIKMHYHLRHMGRKIVEVSGLPRAILNVDDLSQQLNNEQVIKEVRGIRTARDPNSTDVRGTRTRYKENRLYRHFFGKPRNKLVQATKLKLLDVEDGDLVRILRVLHSPNLIWLRWRNCSASSLPDWIPMKNLRVLEVISGVLKNLWQDKSLAPLQLQELIIDSPLSMLPKSIGKLKDLELIILKCPSTGNLKTLPDEFCELQSLKRFELTNCSEIKSLPYSFGNLRKLEHIDLSGSKNLEKLPDSFGILTNLEHIDLSRSENLESLPDSFGDLIKLKYLDLSRCNNLTISSKTLGNIRTLEYINLNKCMKIEELPPQVALQRSLEKLFCPFLEMVPSPLGRDLKELKLRKGRDYKEFRCLPISDKLLNELTKLTVNECVFSAPPFENDSGEPETSASIQSRGERTLSNLGSSIDMSKLLQLRHLELYSTKISEISFAGFCPNLQQLLIRSCDNLVKVGTLPNALIKLELTSCAKLKKIAGLSDLAKLQKLNIKWCRELVELSSIETLASLEALDVNECRELKRIGSLAQLTNLRRLDIVQCSQLEELVGVEDLISRLDIVQCSELEEIAGVEDFMPLKRFKLIECPKLKLSEEVVDKLRQHMIKSKGR